MSGLRDGQQLDLFASGTSPCPSALKSAPRQPAAPVQPRIAPASQTLQDTTPLTAPTGQRRLQLGQHQLAYSLRRSKRRSIGFMIDDDGLRVTAPKWVGLGEIESAIREKQRWILAKLHEHRERAGRQVQPPLRWHDGAQLPYLGRMLRLCVGAAGSDGVRFDADTQTLLVNLPADATEQQVKDRVHAWLQNEARLLFAARAPVYADKLDVRYRSLALSSATTRWGSCTADGKIRLNWRLIHFAVPLIDYVIAHELAHLREMNHGPRFWATVQSVFPEFIAAKKALRDHVLENLPAF